MNKKKILNDPVYGFVAIPSELTFDIIQHPYFQRLRRVHQLGLTHFVYPGALHTRFQHAIGALHLMGQALEVLRSKGHDITEKEAEGVRLAILLHDIGHGPYSHTLERTIIAGVHHEEISSCIMEKLNKQFDGALDTALQIFNDQYPKKFLHQLVSGQLDMDRMDYLNRDSFFTGVYEGVIGYDRIIKMLDVHDDRLVVEAKGIYSIEKFIIARRLMYWQVYLHKTVLAAEQMLLKALQRAKELSQGRTLFATPALQFFLKNKVAKEDFIHNEEVLEQFTHLDDHDVFAAVKVWASDKDPILSTLCISLVERHLFKVELQKQRFEQEQVEDLKAKAAKHFNISLRETNYLVLSDSTQNYAYQKGGENINILFKDGTVRDIADASDQLNISVLSRPVVKYYLCFPKELKET